MSNKDQDLNNLNEALIKYKWILFKNHVMQAKDDPHISFQYGKLMYALHNQGFYSWSWDSRHAMPSSMITLLCLGFIKINHKSSIPMFSDYAYRKYTCTLTQEGKNYLSYIFSSPVHPYRDTRLPKSSALTHTTYNEHHKKYTILSITAELIAVIVLLISWIIFWNFPRASNSIRLALFTVGQVGFFGLSILANWLYGRSSDSQQESDPREVNRDNMSFNSGGHYLDANYVFDSNYDEYENQVQQLKQELQSNNMMTRKHCIIFLDDYNPVHTLEDNKGIYILANIIHSMFPS